MSYFLFVFVWAYTGCKALDFWWCKFSNSTPWRSHEILAAILGPIQYLVGYSVLWNSYDFFGNVKLPNKPIHSRPSVRRKSQNDV